MPHSDSTSLCAGQALLLETPCGTLCSDLVPLVLALSSYWVEMFQLAPSTLWEGFPTCLSEPCYIRQPNPYPDHHTHCCRKALGMAAMPSALLSLQHQGQQP